MRKATTASTTLERGSFFT